MVNTILQLLRNKKQMFPVIEDITEDMACEIPLGENILEKEDLLEMISKLPVNQRIVFNLFAIEGYNHHEISKMTGMPENTSKSHLHRARTTLKEMIKIHSSRLDQILKNASGP